MKNLTITLTFIIACLAASGQESGDLPGKTRIYMSPWSFLASTFQLLFEQDHSKGSFLLAGDALVINNSEQEIL